MSSSPAEYNHAQIPGAYSLPLFTDEERKAGWHGLQTTEPGRQRIRSGDFGVKTTKMVEDGSNNKQ